MFRAEQCRLGLFQDCDFAGDLEDSKSTSGGTFCVSDSHTFVPISCEGGGDVEGVVTSFIGGVAQAFHGDQVVELRVQLAVQQVEGTEEDRKGQVEVGGEAIQGGALMDDYGDVYDKTQILSQ